MQQSIYSYRNIIGFIEDLCYWMQTELGEALATLDIDIQRARILLALSDNKRLRQVELGQIAYVPQYTTSRIVDSLEQRDLVCRMKDPESRRAHLIGLTNRGEVMAKKIVGIKDAFDQQQLVMLSSQEQDQLGRLIYKVLQERN